MLKGIVFLIINGLYFLSIYTNSLIAQAIPDIEWDAAFTRTEGWTGGDAAGSVDLGNGRTLWMFADSWIGGVAEGKHAPGSHMINNAIAVHDSSFLGNCRVPRYKDISFYWGPADKKGKPTAWIIPEIEPEKTWYWFNGSGVVIPSPEGQNRLVMFLFKLTTRGEEGSAWNFQGIGSAMAIVDNFTVPPDKWKVRQVEIPYGAGFSSQPGDSLVRITNWGVSTWLPEGGIENESERRLYIYGIDDTNPWDKHLLLARVKPEDIEKLDMWEYYAGEKEWSSGMDDAISIAGGMVSELSVDEYSENGKMTLILTQSEPMFGKRILVRTASNPEGPWSDPEPVYTVPGLDRGKDYFTYAAKGHLHLSCNGELLISYIINSNSFWDMAGDASIYRPRFVRVPVEIFLPGH